MTGDDAVQEIRSKWRYFFPPDKSKKGIVCPICGNGSGSDGDGIRSNPKSKKQRREEFLSFIEEEPYKSAIGAFDAKTYRRQDWLFAVRQIRAKRFFVLDAVVSSDRRFSVFSGVYKRLAKVLG